MFRRGLVLSLVLGVASVANAGAVLELTVSDMGTVDSLGNRELWTDITGPVNPGDQIMVHAWMTSDTAFQARLIQFDSTGPANTVPFAWLGVDVDTVNQPWPGGIPDGIPNFWFDYFTPNSFQGRFPAQGMIDIIPSAPLFSSTGGYTDFSDLLPGDPVQTAWATSTPGGVGSMYTFVPGTPLHIGAMVVSIPGDAVAGDYVVDLLNSGATSDNNGARIDWNFDTPTTWSVPNGMITYADGTGAVAFSVVPEPATLVLLGLGGLAAIRRRRSA